MDWKDLGLKCGLEIHQQLDTKKLFCNCLSELPQGHPKTYKRVLRTSAGESGEVDVASLAEIEKGKYFIYQMFPKVTCLVELDEEPIHEINEEALKITVETAKLLNAKLVDEIQVMRKTVVDGSNTSGFQRTALVATDGNISLVGKNISIQSVCIEEEAAKIVERTTDYDVYDLSRLGIPLVEIATGPDIRSPEEARQVAEHLGMILRSTGKVKRGIGTIRQDLNVSIEGGTRIEIKGAQELRMLSELVEKEAHRQYHLIQLKQDLVARNVRKPQPNPIDVTQVMKNCESKTVKKIIEENGVVLGMRLPAMAGLLGIELYPNYRFGSECAGYAKIEAGVAGIFHSDELPSSAQAQPKYGISFNEVHAVRKLLDLKKGDAFFMVAGNANSARKAVDAVCRRIRLAFEGVPKEVRKANDDGSTTYLRPIPGAARMYPETDTGLIKIPDVGDVKIELIDQKIKRLESAGISKDLATQLAKSAEVSFFDFVMAKYPELEPLFVAKTLLLSPKEIESRLKLKTENLNDEIFELLFAAVHDKKISKEAVFEALVDICKGNKFDILKYGSLSDEELEKKLRKIISDHPKMPFNGLIGKAMEELRGKAEGKKIVGLLKKLSG
ncbi:MAG TPA: Glu-tRNA(Gln) amidotransferase subunit GatE [Candidatus Nanoarchaeia archaeon]|nr:Glu-tRNA(Gln) amidotransferase subunit GatE [Candidatus Nanoarchaeia archaeon]